MPDSPRELEAFALAGAEEWEAREDGEPDIAYQIDEVEHQQMDE